MKTSSIKVPANWYQDGEWRRDPAEFKLGLGPCGLTVTSLEWVVEDGCLYIKQAHSDGPLKHFVYPLAQLTGRIEVEWSA